MTDTTSAPEQSLVEHVAKAIYDSAHMNLSNCYVWEDHWEDFQEARREQYYRDARAAIEALNRTDATASTDGLVELRPEDCATSDEAQRHLAIRSPLNRAIYKAIRDYRLSNMADEDGHPYPLVDCLSNPAPADIGTGEMEMVALTDEIEAATALSSQATALAEAAGSDWFAGDVDCDGNELVTIRADELQKLRDEREKFMWQVRDTCVRAEKAEAKLKSRTTPGGPRDAGERP